jgi:WD40 repeat protein
VLAVGDGRARLYDLQTGDLRWSHRVDGGGAAFTDRGRSVVLVADSSLVVLDSTTGKPRRPGVPIPLAGPVEELVPSADDATVIVVVLGKPRARAFALPTGAIVGRVKHARAVTDAAFAPRGRVAASSGREWAARIWNTRTWQEVGEPLRGHNGQVLAIALDKSDTAGGRIATASTDQTARVWRLRTGRSVILFGHTGPVNDVAFGPGGVVATASGDATARTWRANGDSARTLLGHTGPVRKVEFAADGTVVTGGADGTIRIWDPGTTIELVPAPHARGPSPPQRRAVNADRTASATAEGKVIRLRTTAGAKLLEGHNDIVNSVSFSPDGRRLVSAGRDHDVIVWDVVAGRALFKLDEAQSASVEDARFSPDGRWLVTAGPKSARLWSADGKPVRFLYGPKTPLTAAGFEPDSRAVVTREGDGGVVRRWECELCGGLRELVALGESRLRTTGRALQPEERARYLD